MPHQFLLHLHQSFPLVQPRTIRVLERMPTDFSEFRCRNLARVMDENSLCQHHTPDAAPHVGHSTTPHPEGRRCLTRRRCIGQITCASPSASPANFAGSRRASMQVRIAILRAGGRARSPLTPNVDEYCELASRTSFKTELMTRLLDLLNAPFSKWTRYAAQFPFVQAVFRSAYRSSSSTRYSRHP
jgi:hypothetical protein